LVEAAKKEGKVVCQGTGARFRPPQGDSQLCGAGLIETARDPDVQLPHHHSVSKTLTGRFGTPEEIAAAVRFLAGPQARYITGQTLHMNGGVYLGKAMANRDLSTVGTIELSRHGGGIAVPLRKCRGWKPPVAAQCVPAPSRFRA
jgi:hypothetical protein